MAHRQSVHINSIKIKDAGKRLCAVLILLFQKWIVGLCVTSADGRNSAKKYFRIGNLILVNFRQAFHVEEGIVK
jgi:hypothetical protein